jgi:hypothetical protein
MKLPTKAQFININNPTIACTAHAENLNQHSSVFNRLFFVHKIFHSDRGRKDLLLDTTELRAWQIPETIGRE